MIGLTPNHSTEQDPFASVWSDQDRQLARSLLRRVMAASVAAGTPTYLDSGTLLGFVREGKILDWDDDIDLVMVGERRVPVLIEKLAQQGLRVLDPTDPQLRGLLKIYDPLNLPTEWRNYSYTWPFIDIFVYDWRGPKLTCKCPFKHSSFYENPYSPGRQEMFEDVLCWVPEQPLVLLDRYYTDWRFKEVSTSWNHRLERAAASVAERPIKTDERGRRIVAEDIERGRDEPSGRLPVKFAHSPGIIVRPGTAGVSFIIPALDAADTLDAAIESVVQQSGSEWEAIVVNDGSRDATAEIARRWCVSHSRIHLINSRHSLGVSGARNLGARQASGSWLVFLDADDLISPDYLEIMLEATRSEVATDFVCCAGAKLAPDGRVGESRPPPKDDLFRHVAESNPFFTQGLIRKTLFQEFGGFDTTLTSCEDWDLWQRFARAGVGFTPVFNCLAYYRMRPNSLSRSDMSLLRCGELVIRRGHGRDPRVRRPLPDFANGLPSHQAPKAIVRFTVWCAGLTIGRGRDPRSLLERTNIGFVPDFDIDLIARTMKTGVCHGACALPVDWQDLRVTFQHAIRDAIFTLERRCEIPDLASRLTDRLYESGGSPALTATA